MKRILWGMFLLSVLAGCSGTRSAVGVAEEKEIRIGLFADPQYGDLDDRGPRHYRSSLVKLPECIDTFNREEVDRVVCLGDIVDRNPEELDVLLPLIGKSKAPVHYVLGNHDFIRLDDVEAHRKKLGMPALYYTIELMGWKLMFLDTNDISNYVSLSDEKKLELKTMLEKIENDGTPNGQNWNGGVGKEQLAWIRNELEQSQQKNQKVIVFAHHPLAPMTNHTLLNAQEVLDLLTSYRCVKAYLNGHYHPGAYQVCDGLPCITLESMLEGGERNSFAIMKLYDDRIELDGYGRVGSRTISLVADKIEK